MVGWKGGTMLTQYMHLLASSIYSLPRLIPRSTDLWVSTTHQHVCGFNIKSEYWRLRSGLAEDDVGWRCVAGMICALTNTRHCNTPLCDSLDAEVLASEDGTDTTTGAIYFEGFPPSIAFFVVRAAVGWELNTQ